MPRYFFQTDTNKDSHSQSCLNKNTGSTTEFPRTYSRRCSSETHNREECADLTQTMTEVPVTLSLGGFGGVAVRGWCREYLSPFVLPPVHWGGGRCSIQVPKGGRDLGVHQSSSSPGASPDKQGQQVLMGLPLWGSWGRVKTAELGSRQTRVQTSDMPLSSLMVSVSSSAGWGCSLNSMCLWT